MTPRIVHSLVYGAILAGLMACSQATAPRRLLDSTDPATLTCSDCGLIVKAPRDTLTP